ncbi:MAG: GtrA family protein [Porcipelethomonas sp.]
MKEFFQLLLKLDFRSLLFTPTDNGFLKFFRYCFVGGIAFVVDYGVCAAAFMMMGEGTVSTVIGTALGFIFGIIVNFLLSKKFVFTEDAKTGAKGEFVWYTVIGIIGLGINEVLMLVCTDWVFSMNQYISKIIVAIIVLIYNYAARKIFLY